MVYLNPRWIVVDFLRHRLTDPRARAEATATKTITATASQTEFQVTPPSGSVSCITAVTVDGTAKTKWQDYYIYFKGTSGAVSKVVFFTGITAGASVAIYHKYGSSNWIFGDKTNEKLSASAFPRLSILTAGGTEKRVGSYQSNLDAKLRFQVSVWAKERSNNQVFDIDDVNYSGEELAEYLAYQIKDAFNDYESDLHPALYGYEGLGLPRAMPFNDELQCHHKVLEFFLSGIDVGSVN